MTKQIPLSQGLFATVSDEDYDYLSQWKWFAAKRSPKGQGVMYNAGRQERVGNGKQKTVYMARVVLERMGFDMSGKIADHIIIPETLNNTRENLRPATRSESSANRRTWGSSRYRGVCWDKEQGNWRASIHIDNKRENIGRYIIEEDAARAYDRRALEIGGRHPLNFPEDYQFMD